MTDEEIRKLAQTCAEACLERYSSIQDSEIAKAYIDVMETVIKSIMETHCIVEKERARELVRLTLEHGDSDDHGLIDGLVDWVYDNFDEEYREEAEKPKPEIEEVEIETYWVKQKVGGEIEE
ncbi:MAG: hypothetical protein K2H46_00145 [Muribaculaceae bacterium]|nr:hypothetical protein [Muribaculaceae bacterium]